MKKRNPTKRVVVNLILSFLLIVIATCGSIISFSKSFDYSFQMIDEDNSRPFNSNIHDITITISKDSTLQSIADLLYDQNFIGNKFWFLLESRLYKLSDKLKPGTYLVRNNMTNHEIVELLTSEKKTPDEIQFTIPEGFTIMQIAQRLDSAQIVSKEDFIDAVNNHSYDYDFLQNLPAGIDYKLEGYLFPDTYRIQVGTTAEEIVTMMLDRFVAITNLYTQYLYDSDYTLHDILTIASIIEHEAKLDEERPIIAGVIYNRLENVMKLQMCSTVHYALGERKTALAYEDLKVDSPYNTYLYEGLPVAPICNPGESALRAAFMPDTNDFYYFVLKDVNQGSHVFSQTAAEHSLNKDRYKQSQDINFID